jgi:hypothetical protein
MKKLFTLIAAILISINLFAQAPQKMSYQAVIRNESNVLVTNAPVKMKISILQGSTTGTVVYSEEHNPTTNANGLVSIEIGGGTNKAGTFSTIDWGNGTYFLKTETDPANGNNLSIVGTSQLLSVPYALESNNAKNAENAISAGDGVKSVFGDTLTLNNGDKYVIPGIKKIGNPPSTINNGLVGYWPFNGNANDESGNGNNGTVNGATLTTDRFGNSIKAYSFDRNNANYTELNQSDILNLSNELSISCWIYLNEYVHNQNLVSKGTTSCLSPHIQYSLKMGSPHIDKAEIQLSINGINNTITTSSIIPLKKWILITGTYDGNKMKIYINENEDTFKNVSGGITQYPTKVNFGRWAPGINCNNPQYLNGALDDIRIYNRALTQGEITWLANN